MAIPVVSCPSDYIEQKSSSVTMNKCGLWVRF